MRVDQLQESAVAYNASHVRKLLSREDAWRFRLLDAATGNGLPQGEFALYQDGFLLVAAASDEAGWIHMPLPKPGVYQVKQTRCPTGYRALALEATLTIDPRGNILLEKEKADGFRFYNIPRRKRLILERGQEFPQGKLPYIILSRDGRRMDVAIPDPSGSVRLPLPEPGAYTLTEQESLDSGASIHWACALAVGNQGTVCLQRIDHGREQVVEVRVR